jgi:hypothetical protein
MDDCRRNAREDEHKVVESRSRLHNEKRDSGADIIPCAKCVKDYPREAYVETSRNNITRSCPKCLKKDQENEQKRAKRHRPCKTKKRQRPEATLKLTEDEKTLIKNRHRMKMGNWREVRARFSDGKASEEDIMCLKILEDAIEKEFAEALEIKKFAEGFESFGSQSADGDEVYANKQAKN